MEILIFDTHQLLSAIIYPFQWRLQIYIGKNLWHRVLEVNKKQVPLKSYSLEIRIDSVNQILKNKEKAKYTRNKSMLTKITDWEIPCVYIHVYQITKDWGHGPYNKRYFPGLSLTRNRREVHMFYLAREVEKFGHVLAEKRVTLQWLMNSNMVKPEKFGHLHFSLSPYSTSNC